MSERSADRICTPAGDCLLLVGTERPIAGTGSIAVRAALS